MSKAKFEINNLRVAAPCHVPWETMSGDARVRLCHECGLNIYNISEMKAREVEDLIKTREGRLCIRLYKRADGTILTKDCPPGIRAYRKRIARFAGATLATVLGLFSVSFGQKEKTISVADNPSFITRTENQQKLGSLSITVVDPLGALVPRAQIRLRRDAKKRVIVAKTDDDGKYRFDVLVEGKYTLEIKSPGFKTRKFVDLIIKNGETAQIEVEMEVDSKPVVVGIYAE